MTADDIAKLSLVVSAASAAFTGGGMLFTGLTWWRGLPRELEQIKLTTSRSGARMIDVRVWHHDAPPNDRLKAELTILSAHVRVASQDEWDTETDAVLNTPKARTAAELWEVAGRTRADVLQRRARYLGRTAAETRIKTDDSPSVAFRLVARADLSAALVRIVIKEVAGGRVRARQTYPISA